MNAPFHQLPVVLQIELLPLRSCSKTKRRLFPAFICRERDVLVSKDIVLVKPGRLVKLCQGL